MYTSNCYPRNPPTVALVKKTGQICSPLVPSAPWHKLVPGHVEMFPSFLLHGLKPISSPLEAANLLPAYSILQASPHWHCFGFF